MKPKSQIIINLQFALLNGVWMLLSYIPLPVMYVLSDLFYYLLYYVIRYRRKVTRRNLTECFPEKELKEIIRIEKRFYHFFNDYIWETCKVGSISSKEMKKRMTFEGIDEINNLLCSGKSISLYLGHYCNWEWVSSVPLHLNSKLTCGQIYHKIYNPAVNRLFLKNRSRFHAVNVEMKDTLRWINHRIKNQSTSIVGYIADQAPVWNSIHHWVDFLHHDTPAFIGTERITKKYQLEAYYLDIKREKRGYYRARFIKLHDNPHTLPDFELTNLYYQQLEKTIQRDPEFYLWTHNRFKRTREEYNKRKNL